MASVVPDLSTEVADHDIPFGDGGTQPSVEPGATTQQGVEPKNLRSVESADGHSTERGFIERARQAMTPGCPGWTYLTDRGFTGDEIQRFRFGYDANPSHGWQDATGRWHKGPRVVIPWEGNDYYHTDRAIALEAKGAKYVKPSAEAVGPQPVFNPDAINADNPVLFIVEGPLDAYAIEACGYPAMALAGPAWRPVAEDIVGRGYRGTVVALLDYDQTGREKNGELTDYLRAQGVAVSTPDGRVGTKDACEALQRDRAGLRSFLEDVATGAQDEAERAAQERYDAALEAMRAQDPFEVVSRIYRLEDADEPVGTGLDGLDAALGGGLRRGVVVLGAVSSLGKTTLAVQVADHIAKAGRAVLFVTIEQSARELCSKSLTRIMRERYGLSVSTRALGSRAVRDGWGRRENEALLGACSAYTYEIARHMRIMEGTEQPGVEDIRQAAEAMARHDGEPPVVFIDYLQLLRPQDDRLTDKQAIDRNVMALRQMARDMRTTVFAISSLNRSSYSGSISLDSFKESGAIEYGSDVLLGLQPEGMAEQLDRVAEARKRSEANRIMRSTKASAERAVEVVVLKNRSGATPAHGIPLTFYPVESRFIDGRARDDGRGAGMISI